MCVCAKLVIKPEILKTQVFFLNNYKEINFIIM